VERVRRRQILYDRLGELLRELAVLVMVFGSLDALIQREIRNPVAWVLGSLLVATTAFTPGHWCAVESEEKPE
jgi:hypothetical protein